MRRLINKTLNLKMFILQKINI